MGGASPQDAELESLLDDVLASLAKDGASALGDSPHAASSDAAQPTVAALLSLARLRRRGATTAAAAVFTLGPAAVASSASASAVATLALATCAPASSSPSLGDAAAQAAWASLLPPLLRAACGASDPRHAASLSEPLLLHGATLVAPASSHPLTDSALAGALTPLAARLEVVGSSTDPSSVTAAAFYAGASMYHRRYSPNTPLIDAVRTVMSALVARVGGAGGAGGAAPPQPQQPPSATKKRARGKAAPPEPPPPAEPVDLSADAGSSSALLTRLVAAASSAPGCAAQHAAEAILFPPPASFGGGCATAAAALRAAAGAGACAHALRPLAAAAVASRASAAEAAEAAEAAAKAAYVAAKADTVAKTVAASKAERAAAPKSWNQPAASWPFNAEIQAFLRGPEKSATVLVPGGLPGARKVARDFNKKAKPLGCDAAAAEGGVGKRAHVTVTKAGALVVQQAVSAAACAAAAEQRAKVAEAAAAVAVAAAKAALKEAKAVAGG